MMTVNWLKAIPRFLKERDRIQDNPSFAHVTFRQIHCGLANIGGEHPYFGALLEAWSLGRYCGTCPHCKQVAYMFSAAGSPLSGGGGYVSCCLECGISTTHKVSVTHLILDSGLLDSCVSLGYRPILQKADPFVFTFKDGAVATGTHQEIRLEVPGWETFLMVEYPELLEDDVSP